jgi:hypothetical protein
MRLAAVRILGCIALLLGGMSAGAALAGTTDPIGTITSAVSTVIGQTTVASDLAGTATSATAATSGVTGALPGSESSSSSSPSGTSSSDSGSRSTKRASASNPGSPRTRFDRLPRRYESLLERIELGHHVRASIARLQALLASASPEFRARLLRLIRAEIRRLENGGLSPRERAAVRRLRSLIGVLAPAPGASSVPRTSPAVISVNGQVLAARATGKVPGSRLTPMQPPPSGGGIALPAPPSFLPDIPSGRDWWAIVAVVFSVLGAYFLLSLLLAGRRRGGLHSMRGR